MQNLEKLRKNPLFNDLEDFCIIQIHDEGVEVNTREFDERAKSILTFDTRLLCSYPSILVEVSQIIAQKLHNLHYRDISMVIHPEEFGSSLAFGVARKLFLMGETLSDQKHEIYSETAEKKGDMIILPDSIQRMKDFMHTNAVIVVTGALFSGIPTKKLVGLLREAKFDVQGVVTICNIGGVKAIDIDAEFLYSVLPQEFTAVK